MGYFCVVVATSPVPSLDALDISVKSNAVEERPVTPWPTPERDTEATSVKGRFSTVGGIGAAKVDGEPITLVGGEAGFDRASVELVSSFDDQAVDPIAALRNAGAPHHRAEREKHANHPCRLESCPHHFLIYWDASQTRIYA